MKLHITEAALKGCVPSDKPAVKVFDSEVPGFGAQLTRTGAGNYFVTLRSADGQRRQHKLGAIGKLAAHEARQQARELMASVRTGSTPKRGRPPAAGLSVSDFFYGPFLDKLRAQGKQTETHTSLYRNHIEPILGSLPMGKVTAQHAQAFQEQLRRKPVAAGRWTTQAGKTLSEGTVKRVMILLRHLFNEAKRQKVPGVADNPTAALNLGSEVALVKGRFLQPEDVQRLLAVARAHDADFADALLMAALTGLRRSNVYRLSWTQLDFERGLIRYEPAEVKQKKAFVKHLSAPVVQMLQRRLAAQREAGVQTPWVFANPKTGQPYHSRRCLWVTVRNAAGLPNLRLHDLRHSFASALLEAGVNLVAVKEALGHTQLKTTMKYLHITDKARKQTEETLAQRLLQAV
ncbi:Tyrosine recombinase XerD [Tepidimonas thermarum]|uniref:Tyrosine recombinase XerD n=1 Tax=Tepidimonas thermarum TaxID=335431 RepID=A0A554WSJ9_9BURK|nr:site-specific integrase [Tepidimonas thermarum]TSE26568.1 Tyrosine recombinase XerD [Tepidimonas thermarum]